MPKAHPHTPDPGGLMIKPLNQDIWPGNVIAELVGNRSIEAKNRIPPGRIERGGKELEKFLDAANFLWRKAQNEHQPRPISR